MKKVTVGLLCLFLVACGGSGSSDEPKSEAGKKAFRITQIQKSDLGDKSQSRKMNFAYKNGKLVSIKDEEGGVVFQSQYSSDGQIDSVDSAEMTRNYQYNQQGQVSNRQLAAVGFDFSSVSDWPKDLVELRSNYLFSGSGVMPAQQVKYQYDASHRLIQISLGELNYIYTYNSNGQLESEEVKDDSQLLDKTTFYYGANGLSLGWSNLQGSQVKYTYANDKVLTKETIQGDQIIELLSFSHDGRNKTKIERRKNTNAPVDSVYMVSYEAVDSCSDVSSSKDTPLFTQSSLSILNALSICQ